MQIRHLIALIEEVNVLNVKLIMNVSQQEQLHFVQQEEELAYHVKLQARHVNYWIQIHQSV